MSEWPTDFGCCVDAWQHVTPHNAQRTVQLLRPIKWELSDHPSHCMDLVPTDLQLFLHLKTFLTLHNFTDNEDLKSAVERWLNTQMATFYDDGIQKLVPCYDKNRKVMKYTGSFMAVRKFVYNTCLLGGGNGLCIEPPLYLKFLFMNLTHFSAAIYTSGIFFSLQSREHYVKVMSVRLSSDTAWTTWHIFVKFTMAELHHMLLGYFLFSAIITHNKVHSIQGHKLNLWIS